MIWLTQVLCPSRHCMVACPWDDTAFTVEQMERDALQAFDELALKSASSKVCGICLSTVFHCESKPTRWKTMKKALPHLLETQARNIVSGALLNHPNNPNSRPKGKPS